MISNTKLVTVGNFDFKLHHLLIIGVLALSFSMAFLVRVQPVQYAEQFGLHLNEFDPFFNFRATEYMVNNGVEAYYNWHDELSWYPHGRDVSATSQVITHLTAAYTYWIFGGDMPLYEFIVFFPVIFISLTSIVIFALVRVIGGTTAGLIASMLFAVSIPVLVRSSLGWYKSEPMGLFFGILCAYLLLSGITSSNRKVALAKLALGGVITACAISAWGGSVFFIIPTSLFFIALPFVRKDHGFLLWAVPVYTISTLITSMVFERGIFTTPVGVLVLVVATIFLVSCILVQKKSSVNKNRNGLILLATFIVVGSVGITVGIESGLVPEPSYRYLHALNPFLANVDPLTDSISEHTSKTLEQSFVFNSILMVFGGIGIWIIIKSRGSFIRDDMLVYVLIFGIVGVHVSSAFIRLELFASITIIMLSSLGIAILIHHFFKRAADRRSRISMPTKFVFGGVLILLLMTPLVFPPGFTAIDVGKSPPSILNGGASAGIITHDWLDTFEWIKNNTPEDAVIMSWWDYGYWLQTMSNRTTLLDNWTSSTIKIENVANTFMSPPDVAYKKIIDTGADYVLIFIVANKIGGTENEEVYVLAGGGDESKRIWFARIGGFDEAVFLHNDFNSGTERFWNETILGQMIPYSLLGYVNQENIQQQSSRYIPGYLGVYERDIKYPVDGDGPLRLVYASNSFNDPNLGPKLGIFIYEVNKDYTPLS